MKNRIKPVLFAVLTGLLSASGLSAATRCVNPAGTGGCHPTIQAAVTAAVAGDRIVVGVGTYYENVVVPASKTGLQITGASRILTILDPDAPNTGDGITIEAEKVVLANLTIRNGATSSNPVWVTGRDVTIRGVTVTGHSRGIRAQPTAWNFQVLLCDFNNGSGGVLAYGFQPTIKGNTFARIDGTAVYVLADAARVLSNRFANVSYGVDITGDGAVVTGNDVTNADSRGIAVTGSYPQVQGNRVVVSTLAAIQVDCTDCFGGTVSRNTITDTTQGPGLSVLSDGPGLTVQGNVVLRPGGTGLSLSGTGMTVQANRVTDAGASGTVACYRVAGDSNTVVANLAKGCGAEGFYLAGSGNRVERNIVLNALENGFTVYGDAGASTDNTLTLNQTTSAAAQGIAVVDGAVGTELIANRASKSRVDFCDEGTGTVLSGNTFGTTSTTCPIAH